jgi:lysine 2,3-aminomutase
MAKKSFHFTSIRAWPNVSSSQWQDWKWQVKNSLKNKEDFSLMMNLTDKELAGFKGLDSLFRVQATPYYASLMNLQDENCPVRKMILPSSEELNSKYQQMLDPLGERLESNRVCQRLIHRYTDRVLFLITDMCGVYCRYCTRKHFTASDQVLATEKQIEEVVNYLKSKPQVKEVILSGGDPLTIANEKLGKIIKKIYEVESVELIRIGSRMPVACPMRIDDELIALFKEFKPIYFMTHFNHPDELTEQAAIALEKLVDNGIPVFNQLVLLNGINNDPALIYALSRRLLSLRVKPYYMFQADPSMGTDHLRTSIDESLEIQKALWGHSSGLSMPTFIVDIPNGGGKTALNPNYLLEHNNNMRKFKGWDGVEASYISPERENQLKPFIKEEYKQDWLHSF